MGSYRENSIPIGAHHVRVARLIQHVSRALTMAYMNGNRDDERKEGEGVCEFLKTNTGIDCAIGYRFWQ